MSKKVQTSGEDYPDAAEKHSTDARILLTGNRPDGAAYLSGYAVECMLKTLVQVEKGHNRLVWGHNLNDLSWDALSLAKLAGGRTARYFTNSALTTLRYDNPPGGWKEYLRYYPAGTIPQPTAEKWVEEAERLYFEIIGELKKDGEI